jgi:hypothetical protein
MEVSSSNLNFKITMVDVDELKPHEEVSEQAVASLVKDVLNVGEIRDPLIVDQEEYVILDGMHRFSSLKRLECRFMPCCLVDYDSPLIKVGAWFRYFAVDEPESVAEALLKDAGLHYEQSIVDVNSELDPHCAIRTRNAQFSLPDFTNPIQLARTAVALEKNLGSKGYEVDYQAETNLVQTFQSGRSNLVVLIPVFSKQQIREFGIAGRLLPHKVTRHVMPSRPLNIDVPLKFLTDLSFSRETADRKLGELLAKRQIQRQPPGSVVDGRRYEEELLIFSS